MADIELKKRAAPFTLQTLKSPNFLKLSETDQFQVRRQVFRDLKANNPRFNALDFTEQSKVLFPDPLPENVVRERITVGGEFRGGAKEFGEAIKEKGFLGTPLVNLALPTLRMAGAPLAPLVNVASRLGEEVSQATRPFDVLNTTMIENAQLDPIGQFLLGPRTGSVPTPFQPSDIAGALTLATADVELPAGLGKLAGIAKTKVKNLSPFRGEKAAVLAGDLSKAEIAAQQEAQELARGVVEREAREAQRLGPSRVGKAKGPEQVIFGAEERAALAQREISQTTARTAAGVEEREALTQAQRAEGLSQQGAEVAAQKASIEQARQRGLPERGARGIQEEIRPGAPTTQVAGRKFKEEIFPARKKEVTQSFNARYNELYEAADELPLKTTNLEAALDDIIGEAGVLKGSLPTVAESRANRIAIGLSEGGELSQEQALRRIQPRTLRGNKVDTVGLSDDAYRQIREQFLVGTSPAGIVQTGARMVGGDLQTGSGMVRGVIRFRSAERAALDAKNNNVARQFTKMKEALLEDIKTSGDKGASVNALFSEISKDYRRDVVPFFLRGSLPRELIERVREDAQEVVHGIIQPANAKQRVEAVTRGYGIIKDQADRDLLTAAWWRSGIDEAGKTGEFNPKDFVKWFTSYIDPETENAVLKTALGSKFRPTMDFMSELRRSTQGKFDEVADEAIINILKRRGVQSKETLSALGATQKGIKTQQAAAAKESEGILRAAQRSIKGQRVAVSQESKAQIKDIIATRNATVAQLRSEFDKAVESLGGGAKIGERAGWWMGPLMVLGGVGRLASGQVGAGVRGIGGGVIEVMAHGTMIKLLNTVKGAEILRLLARATPGSVEALAAARTLENLARNLPEEGRARARGSNPLVGPPLLPQ